MHLSGVLRWCLIEILEATRKGIPIIVVHMEGSDFSIHEARKFVRGLKEEMGSTNPSGLALLYEHVGQDLHEITTACLGALEAAANEMIAFDQTASDLAMVAMLKDGRFSHS
eukprot:6450811-Prymnesium_polylepis.1